MANSPLDRLNEAEFDELRAMRLSVTQARRLLAYRDRDGGFDSLEELDGLAGFSRASVKELKDVLSGTRPASTDWAARISAPDGRAKEPVPAQSRPTARRTRPRRGGILLFAGFLAAAALVLALVVAAFAAPPRASGVSMAILGVGIIAAHREVAEVRASLDLIRSRILHRALVILFGTSLVVAGLARILA